ncbi:MAG TPA: hypothetical protein VGO67_23055 [Verrucomicrobiae bacterium]|jgi:hypothetical protein
MTKIFSRLTVEWFTAGMMVICLNVACADEIHWPEKQLLPRFAAPAGMLECVDVSSLSGAEYDLLSSLEGIVNRKKPRMACATRGEEGKMTWLDLHKLPYRMVGGDEEMLKYQSMIRGLVVTDPDQPHTLNLATTIAGIKNELICDPSLLKKLTNAPFRFPIVDDLRGRFLDKYAVYGYLYTNFWPQCTHRIFAGMGPGLHGHLRDYLVAMRVATVWLGPGNERDAQLLRMFAGGMKPVHGVYMGWWPGEGDGLEFIARYGIPVLASDFLCNATIFSGTRRAIRVPKIPPPPPIENKVYVALILSDGDNVQYMQHAMKKYWDEPARGSIPIGWTASPLAVDIDPPMLDYYWTTATTNDCLVSGPSGAGYAHVNHWDSQNLAAFTRVSAPYLKQSGLRVITIWDRVNDNVARAFATNCSTLLGLTDQSGKYSKVNLGLQTIRLTPTYTSTVGEMIAGITNAAAGWNGNAPLFIAAQSDVWHLGPSGLAKVAEALDGSEYKLVRPDQLFLLAKQAQKKKQGSAR